MLTRTPNAAYNFLRFSANGDPLVFSIRGDGLVTVDQGGMIINAGGHTVLTGGIHVDAGE